jgi:predicted metal-dependent hydrolase
MQPAFLIAPFSGKRTKDVLEVGSQTVPIKFVRNHRARRYIIRVLQDGSVRATVPRLGSIKAARSFAERSSDWIAKQLQKSRERPAYSTPWQHGTEILYRGGKVPLIVMPNLEGHSVQFADQTLQVSNATHLRAAIECHLRRLATVELTAQTLALAKLHELVVKRITIRNQQSRWGSCSRRGTISLNWRLIQMPDYVRNYVILHELTHTREHNHSQRFWRLVEQLCPEYRDAKLWIKQHRGMLRSGPSNT